MSVLQARDPQGAMFALVAAARGLNADSASIHASRR